jgi:hypothetical protein
MQIASVRRKGSRQIEAGQRLQSAPSAVLVLSEVSLSHAVVLVLVDVGHSKALNDIDGRKLVLDS